MFNLTVHNFRSFQKQQFQFSKVNILIGENNGGKSSLLKLLLALKQTIDSPTEVNLKLSGDFIDLGNFEEVIYYHKKNKKITVGFDTTDHYISYFINFINDFGLEFPKKEIKRIVDECHDSTTAITFDFSSKLDNHSSIVTKLSNDAVGKLEILQHKDNESSARNRTCDLRYEFKRRSGVVNGCQCSKEGFFTLIDESLWHYCHKQCKDDAGYIYYRLVFLLVMQNYVKDQIERIRYVNPIGTSPKRFYLKEDKKATYKLIDIEKFINVLSDQRLSRRSYEDRIALLNKTIKSFGIAEEIKLIKDKQLPVLALNVKTKDFWSNITDVGYGVSLQIPILFQALLSEHYTRDGQTLLIEQPEVHLHPSLQAKFIETLLSIGPKNTYFIETHSEHIVRKLQVLIKSKYLNLKPEDISIHYFKREPQKFSISKHVIDSDGKLSPQFPAGFYDASYSLVKQLL